MKTLKQIRKDAANFNVSGVSIEIINRAQKNLNVIPFPISGKGWMAYSDSMAEQTIKAFRNNPR